MVELTKRSTLRLFGTGLAFVALSGATTAQEDGGDGSHDEASEDGADGGETSDDSTPVETVVEVPGDPVPENLALDWDGTLYFGITAGEVWEVTNAQTQETGLTPADLTRVAELPGSVVGVEVVPCGSIYVASSSDEETGVWEVPRDGHAPFPLASVPGFPNDVLYDPDFDRLLVTESFDGAVYEVSLSADDPEAELWFEDDALETESFGANGLAFGRDGAVFVAVTRAVDDGGADVGRLVRVPVETDGTAGEAETYLESPAIFGADGVTTDGADVYVAANSQNRVVRVAPDRRVEVVADGDDGLVFPSDVLFGVTPRQRSDLFVCNFANDSPDDGAILRAHPFATEDDDGDEGRDGDGGDADDGNGDADDGNGDPVEEGGTEAEDG
jgi:sugar lactone lactonase YvrE